jgi:hypothetical protein
VRYRFRTGNIKLNFRGVFIKFRRLTVRIFARWRWRLPGNVFIMRKSKNPAEAGCWKKLKLTDKPLSFGYSVVDSHSSH